MRSYQIAGDSLKYLKGHEWKNHSCIHRADVPHGSFECRSKIIMRFLGWLWKAYGVRVLR